MKLTIERHTGVRDIWYVEEDDKPMFDFANGCTYVQAAELVRRVNAYDKLVECIKEYSEMELYAECQLCCIGIDHIEHIGCYCADTGKCEFCVEQAVNNAEKEG